jgi:hypothetical protein
MSLTTHTITNAELQQQVEEEVRWDPAVAWSAPGVTKVTDDLVIR